MLRAAILASLLVLSSCTESADRTLAATTSGAGQGGAPGTVGSSGVGSSGGDTGGAPLAGSSGTGAGGDGGAGTGGADAGGMGGANSGVGGAGGSWSTGAGGSEPTCADPNAGVAWAGDWGWIGSHGCFYFPGLGDPVTFDISNSGHDCQMIAADIWIPGITEVDGNVEQIRAELFTNFGSSNPSAFHAQTLVFEGRFGNNYRYRWSPYLLVVPPGSYSFWFRFSYGDANQGCWYRIGAGAGPSDPIARTVNVMP